MSEERRREIIALLETERHVRVEDLARRFDVSEVTIRKDLSELEARGLLQRTHGGAVLVHKSRFNPSFLEKLALHAAEKRAIAHAALEYICEGDALILDAGSTTLALAKAMLGRFRHLTVVTSSVPIALELAHAGWDLILTGGQVREHSLALIGPAAVNTLEGFHVDKAFLGATGVTLRDGYSTPNPLDAQLKQAMMRAADESYVLTDSSKLGRGVLANYARLEEVKLLITDAHAPADFLASLQHRGIAYKLARPNTDLNGEDQDTELPTSKPRSRI
ncbi:MAG: DeoR/GlpR family DNA-binding transcription regulator [Candidatus Brachytrichaceae bacterium NZ_4S206]|jgi:DeoR family transcriptional regulator of aga operon/DeoR family fructose operon transcriptional repressor